MISTIQKRAIINTLIWVTAAALVVFTVQELPISEMIERIHAIPISVWVTLFLINLVILFLAVKRWQLLSEMFDIEIPFASLFMIRQAGNTISYVTPGPQLGGEPLQAYWLNNGRGISMDITLALIGADRFLEIFINLSILFFSILLIIYGDIEADLSDALLFVSLSLLSVVALLSLFFSKYRIIANSLFSLSNKIFQKLPDRDQENRVITNIDAILSIIQADRLRVSLAMIIGVIGWIALIFELYLIMSAVNLIPDFYDIVLVMLGIRIALLMPIPGGVGTVETSLIWSFGILDLSLGGAGGVIVLNRIRDLIILALGAVCLFLLSRLNSK